MKKPTWRRLVAKLSLEEVESIAELARLSLTDEEKQMYQDQLSAILDYVEQLQGLDTDDVVASSSALPLDNVMRSDVKVPTFSADEALANAPEKEDDQFRVKPILDWRIDPTIDLTKSDAWQISHFTA